jgi:DnaK suppressor protein
MNKTILYSFREKLEEIRLTILDEVKEQYKSSKDNLNEQAADIADDATQSYDQQFNVNFVEKNGDKLRLVEEAIKKIKNGNYGVCSECDGPIPEGRLELVPFTEHCVNCLETLENNKKRVT